MISLRSRGQDEDEHWLEVCTDGGVTGPSETLLGASQNDDTMENQAGGGSELDEVVFLPSCQSWEEGKGSKGAWDN